MKRKVLFGIVVVIFLIGLVYMIVINTVFNKNADYSLQDGEFHLFTCIWNADE